MQEVRRRILQKSRLTKSPSNPSKGHGNRLLEAYCNDKADSLKAKRAKEILHEDLRTNLNSFSSWLHAYIVSPDRQLSNKGVKQLEKLVARRRKNITQPSNEIVTEEMRHVIDLWEQEAMQVGSIEWRRSRIREVRDMFIIRGYNQ